MTVADPTTRPELLTYARIAGKRTPGILELGGNSGSPRAWDERGGYGLTGSTLVFTGKKLAAFDMVLSLYTKQDWLDWRAFLPTVALPFNSFRPPPLDIVHPYTSDYGVFKFVVLDIAWPKTTDEGVTQILIPCKAFRGVKYALSKPTSAKATPTDPVDAQIAASNAELQGLNQQLAGKK